MPFIPQIVAWLIVKGIPARLAKPLLAFVALCAAAGLLWAAIAYHDRNVIRARDAKVEQQAAKATDQAATERANDTIALNQSETEVHNVIASQPDRPIAPTSHALSCERLRRAGRTPPACR